MSRLALIIANYVFAAAMLPSHIGGYAASGIGLFFSYSRIRSFLKENTAKLLLGFIVYGAALSLFSPEPSVGFACMLGYFSQWLLPFLLGFALSDKEQVKKVFTVFYVVFYLILILSFLAYFGLFPKEIGPGNFLANTEDGLLKGLRSHIAFAALCLLFSFMSSSRALFDNRLTVLKKTIFWALAVLPLGAIVLTGSRGYFLAATVSYAVFLVYVAVRTKKYALLSAFVAVTFLASSGLFFGQPRLSQRVSRTGPADESVAGRFAMYKIALSEIKANPVFGVGPGQGTRQLKYFGNLTLQELTLTKHVHLHSFYLHVAAEFGLLGLAAVILLFYSLLKRIYSAGHSLSGFERALAVGLFFGIIGILIGDMFDTLLRGPGTAMEVFWLSGLIFGITRKT